MKFIDIDLEDFERYVIERGGVPVPPRITGGECFAFEEDGIRGGIVRRRDLTYSTLGLAHVYYEDYASRMRSSVPFVVLTLTPDELDLAAALLADVPRATCYVSGIIDRSGRGGWGIYISAGFLTIKVCGGFLRTTPIRIEITATLIALKILPPDSGVKIVAASPHLRRSMRWLPDWRGAKWISFGTGGSIPDRDLWESLDDAMHRRRVVFKWLTPLDDNFELKDRAASLAASGLQSIVQLETIDA